MSILSKTYGTLLALTLAASAALTSCDIFNEDLPPCPQGLQLRFVYDYNMEFANAFPSQVDCLILLVYDKEGNYVRTETASRPETADENWRMTVDLPAGDYTLLAYGGMDQEHSSFRFNPTPQNSTFSDLKVYLPTELLTHPRGTDLHPLFYGRAEVSVPETSTEYVQETIYMMKDTNDIRIVLLNENGQPADADEFVFTITDDNTLFNSMNELITAPERTETVYSPWDWGNSEAGVNPDGTPTQVCWAEFSVSRLMTSSPGILKITRASDGNTVVSIPLVNVLLLLKSQHFSAMKNQEFLDRESRWNMTFILAGNGVWAGTTIVINDWVVRLNNINS